MRFTLERLVVKAGLLFLLGSFAALSQTHEKLSLPDAITLALQNNQDVLKAEKEIDAAEGRVLQAGRIPNPEFGVAWNESPSAFSLGAAEERDISLSQALEFPTKRGGRIDVATLDKELALHALERTKTILTERVKHAYHSLLFSEGIINGIEEQLNLLKDFQQLLTARYQSGQSNYLDVVRARIEITRLNNDLSDAKRERRVRQRQLNILMAKSPEDALGLVDGLSYSPIVFRDDSLLDFLARRSATIKIAELVASRQEKSLSLAKTTYLPDFEIGLASQRRGDARNLWGLEFKMSLPLWFWQEPKGLVQEASALADMASVNQSALARRVRSSILNAIELVRVAESQVRTFDASLVMDAQDILSTAISQYQRNQIDVLNLIDVYRTYRATSVEYLRALHNYNVAVAELEAAAELPSED